MFNSYVDNKFNYNVNAVSGTLRKTMKDSKFIIRKLDPNLCIFTPEYQSISYRSAPIVILQIMLIGNNQCLIEYVEKDIFDKFMSDSENGSFKQDEKWQDGADFDNNKANEWHYVKDVNSYEDLHFPPEEEKGRVVIWKVQVITEKGIKQPVCYHCGSYGDLWYEMNAYHVIAWKEIVLPKENEFKSEMFPEITLPEGSSEFINKVIADAEKRVKAQEYSLNYENGIFKFKDKNGKEFVSIDGKTWEESTSGIKGE